MSRHKAKFEEDVQAIDLTPMLDVVFIMLVFFIVTASYVKETGREVMRPDSTTAQDQPKALLLITVTADNEIWMNKQRIDQRALRRTIERMRIDNPKAALSIQADILADMKNIFVIVNTARDAGIDDVIVSTPKRGQP
ncbi:MAG: biopolymer transporter ExbD [Cellvibrio sp. 79]|nr:MAG: biopolymer transporter ExbD [Cellvibrio sp. 79]